MYESFGLAGIQLPAQYKENFDVSNEGSSTCTVSVCIQLFTRWGTLCLASIGFGTHF